MPLTSAPAAFPAMVQQQSPGRQAPDGSRDPMEMRIRTSSEGVSTVDIAPAAPRPLTRSEVAALRAQRSELSDQLISASNRRDELAKDLRQASSNADRAGIEQRMMVLDKRIVQIESDMATTGRQLTAAPASLAPASRSSSSSSSTGTPDREYGPFSGDQLFGLASMSIVLIWFPLAFAAARRTWRRGSVSPAAPQSAETAQRLAHLTDAIDAIAIEVERVSEGQRFVTRLLSEQRGMSALGAAQPAAEPIPVGQHDAQRVPRGAGA